MASHISTRLVAIAALLLVAGCNSSNRPCPPEKIGLWSADGVAEVYLGDELFIYINGGAEIYHEYGFEQVSVQRYQRGNNRILVEIYTMDGDAFGIYSFARSPSGSSVNLGSGATAADYYLHLWSGHGLAVITAENEFQDLSEAVLEISSAVAGCLQPGGAEPDLLLQLPNEGRVSGSEVYFTGQLAFLNVARPAAIFFSGFEEGAVARYGPDEHAVILRWQDQAAADRAFQTVGQKCKDSGGKIIETKDPNVVEFDSGKHRISASGAGNLITLRIAKEES
jgi:hypothetical protein